MDASGPLPLAGLRVLVTRAPGQAAALSARLRALGAEPVELPVIAFVAPADPAPLDAAIAQLASYDWIIFTSANGVDAFATRVDALDGDLAPLRRAQLAAIGPATAARLEDYGLRAAFVPERFVAESVLAGLVERGVAGRRVLLPRAETARDVLPEGLRQAGAEVDVVAAYRTVTPVAPPEQLAELHDLDVVTLTSSSTARNLAALLDGRLELLGDALVACIGPITAETARELGFRVGLVAEDYSIPGLVEALTRQVANRAHTHTRTRTHNPVPPERRIP
jgi:uroporphyrinogen-III synthase